jgi:GGDEF domain-containing protein
MSEALAAHRMIEGSVGEVTGTDRPNGGPSTRERAPGPDQLVELLHQAAGPALGIDVIYDALGLLAERLGLEDVVLSVDNETLGFQVFRLGGRPIGLAELSGIGPGASLISTPDVVPPKVRSLVIGIAEVALSTHVAQRGVIRDRVTGLLSRSVFNEALRAAAAQSSRYGWTFTIMVLRVDDGAEIRSEAGIRRLGYAFGRALRSGDTGGRLYRGTFTALLPNATSDSLHALVRRFCEESGLPSESISYASATAPTDSVDPAELFRLAGSRMADG